MASTINFINLLCHECCTKKHHPSEHLIFLIITCLKKQFRRIDLNSSSQTMLPQLFSMCERNSIPATFFELTSTLAFIAFQQSKCEAVVVEVGLGGKLDSTNIITPTLCIITSIQLDHVQILGDTIEKIAAQKAGESETQRKCRFSRKLFMCILISLHIRHICMSHTQYRFFAIYLRWRGNF